MATDLPYSITAYAITKTHKENGKRLKPMLATTRLYLSRQDAFHALVSEKENDLVENLVYKIVKVSISL